MLKYTSLILFFSLQFVFRSSAQSNDKAISLGAGLVYSGKPSFMGMHFRFVKFRNNPKRYYMYELSHVQLGKYNNTLREEKLFHIKVGLGLGRYFNTFNSEKMKFRINHSTGIGFRHANIHYFNSFDSDKKFLGYGIYYHLIPSIERKFGNSFCLNFGVGFIFDFTIDQVISYNGLTDYNDTHSVINFDIDFIPELNLIYRFK